VLIASIILIRLSNGIADRHQFLLSTSLVNNLISNVGGSSKVLASKELMSSAESLLRLVIVILLILVLRSESHIAALVRSLGRRLRSLSFLATLALVWVLFEFFVKLQGKGVKRGLLREDGFEENVEVFLLFN
jgi:hypothetical protein